MLHDQFLSYIYSRLSTVISNDPLLADIRHCNIKNLPCSKLKQYKQASLIHIAIRRFDDSRIDINISENSRVFELKRAIKDKISNKKIHWKSVWKRYALAIHKEQLLTNDNQRIKHYGVQNNTELFFVRRRRLK